LENGEWTRALGVETNGGGGIRDGRDILRNRCTSCLLGSLRQASVLGDVEYRYRVSWQGVRQAGRRERMLPAVLRTVQSDVGLEETGTGRSSQMY
jgi:hypothetical protein